MKRVAALTLPCIKHFLCSEDRNSSLQTMKVVARTSLKTKHRSAGLKEVLGTHAFYK